MRVCSLLELCIICASVMFSAALGMAAAICFLFVLRFPVLVWFLFAFIGAGGVLGCGGVFLRYGAE